ncbi:hypothetical protein P175DRAFT_0521934 [Aspergillus ochraceoroseus IBT 24754]|uniref:Uncharacterized protein n=1 Tax=Aspergillus ochraceoroseus IBT 24754 TaxID=1392256 RepID=A0A2T5M2T7_9EURO|nr:uncharacterized protein P175DRAFT_0521934 [Aspergillus ochraceoroseus IBT 24754]PTU22841.1 hypothetical protein P175DRAFT_0521934 [Aspergillus ochraceoroseus IBT 24754]
MSSKDHPSDFTQPFSDNAKYTRSKAAQSRGQRDRSTAFTTMNPDLGIQDSAPPAMQEPTTSTTSEWQQSTSTSTSTRTGTGSGTTGMSSAGSGGGGGGWNRGSRYSFTAETLAHPDDKTAPDE